MHQLILGAAIPLALALVIYIIRHFRAPMWLLVLTPPAMGFCAIWAVVPDIPRIVGWHSLYEKMQTPLSDIFFWHYSIDQIEAAHLDSMTPLFNAIFALLLLALLAAAWRELYKAEQLEANKNVVLGVPAQKRALGENTTSSQRATTKNISRSLKLAELAGDGQHYSPQHQAPTTQNPTALKSNP